MNTSKENIDEYWMRRALQLASNGAGHVSPNPMVGAVIVGADGRILGEGWHRKYGGPHAEVQAFMNVLPEDEPLLRHATIYVTLEPCSHYGKTPPCALLLKSKGIRRAVIGCGDPNPKVAGKGIAILREAGIEVAENVLRDECMALNKRFMTAQIYHRPWILLKWAQSADGFMAAVNPDYESWPGAQPYKPVKLSTPVGAVLMHRERTLTDAIMVGTNTLLADNPSLTARLWPGKSPRPVIFRSPDVPDNLNVFDRDPIILDPALPLERNMKKLFTEHGVTSIMVEGGSKLLQSFLDAGFYDEIRIEKSDIILSNGLIVPKIS